MLLFVLSSTALYVVVVACCWSFDLAVPVKDGVAGTSTTVNTFPKHEKEKNKRMSSVDFFVLSKCYSGIKLYANDGLHPVSVSEAKCLNER